ncbi:GAF domain-containing protein [Leptospira stimsonii]|uniref:GAF domain-containing protein n=1 Tax=Leptospira stimsonii TaxID=2202203 RepID=A0A396YPF9_9LEPT|nr:GAF domain-containing protein [Leptospira stimsonii]RHX85102.1 GAF domain-containing protein [Leptospira stimsonii]
MAESLTITTGLSREKQYEELFPQLVSLVEGESDPIANLANLMAALKQTFGFFWVGIYFVRGEELVLGPFQGPIACTRIAKGKGVCGTAWESQKTVLVPDVEKFPGHIACSSESRSEIVVPGFDLSGNVEFVLDVDSDMRNDFSDQDRIHLEMITSLIQKILQRKG